MVRVSTLVSAVAALASFGSAVPVGPEKLEKEFENYVRQFRKQYAHEKERAARFAAFVENYNFIERENSKGHSYVLGINEFADMTADEFSMTHLGMRGSSQRWGDLPYLGRHQTRNQTLPTSVDWSQQGAVTPVKNQAQCGSCWAFSSTGALEGAWKIATGQLQSISEQQLVDCSGSFGNQGCSGGEMDGAFKYAQGAALCTEDSYPYEAKNGICRASTCKTAVPQGAVVGFKDVSPDDSNALMDAVAQQPVSVAIEADRMVFQLYRSGVLDGVCGTTLDHGVLVVGYGTDSGKDYWLVKNSWGASWGMNGYVKLYRGKPGAGECGINHQPSYPLVKKVEEPVSI